MSDDTPIKKQIKKGFNRYQRQKPELQVYRTNLQPLSSLYIIYIWFTSILYTFYKLSSHFYLSHIFLRVCDNLYKKSGLGEPTQKIVTVLSWNFKHFTPSSQGTERLTINNGYGSAWLGLWAMQVNVDERHSILA